VCKSIETARCEVAPSCPGHFNLQNPTPSGDPVEACIRYYDVECLHGLTTSVEPSNAEVSACVSEIHRLGDAANAKGVDAAVPCGLLATPQDIPQCSFLNPPAAASEDAGEDATGDGPDEGGMDAGDSSS
jgi:hypothetical protein